MTTASPRRARGMRATALTLAGALGALALAVPEGAPRLLVLLLTAGVLLAAALVHHGVWPRRPDSEPSAIGLDRSPPDRSGWRPSWQAEAAAPRPSAPEARRPVPEPAAETGMPLEALLNKPRHTAPGLWSVVLTADEGAKMARAYAMTGALKIRIDGTVYALKAPPCGIHGGDPRYCMAFVVPEGWHETQASARAQDTGTAGERTAGARRAHDGPRTAHDRSRRPDGDGRRQSDGDRDFEEWDWDSIRENAHRERERRARGRDGAHGGQRRDPRAQGLADRAEARRVLGVAASASREQIESAWRQRIRRAHPDHGGSTAEAARLNWARDMLLKKEG